MNRPVSSKLAKFLKEKGLDEVTNYIYSEVYGYVENINGLKHSDGNNRFISAPTIAQVVMWLYEKHGIWIWVSMEVGYHTTFCWQLTGETISSNHKSDFKSPTEAYEAAIEYTLKNLI